MAQLAVYSSLKLAVTVLKEKKPERLYETLTKEEDGNRVRRTITDRNLKKMKATSKKAWSVRVLRWLELMPEQIKQGDMTKRKIKEELKLWIKHTIPVRGDQVLWGQKLTGNKMRRRGTEDQGPQDQGDGAPDEDPRPGDQPGPHNSQEEGQVQALGRRAGGGVRSEAGEEESTSQAADFMTSSLKSKEIKASKGELQGQHQEGFWRRLSWKRYGGKRKQRGTGQRSLPGSLAAVVKTSPKGSGETGTTRTGLSGEREGEGTGTAGLLPHAGLPEGEAQLSKRRTDRERTCCRTDVVWGLGWTRGYLLWRKGVG